LGWAGASEGTAVSKNAAAGNTADGIFVEDGSDGTLVERDVASRNGDDGIHVESPATTLTPNIANRNRDVGIEAVPGVTDGGGHRASRNGNPAQCTHVVGR